jgi:hypothetical protein
VPTKPLREALMSRYRRLKIEGGAFFCTRARADRGGNATELYGRSVNKRVGKARNLSSGRPLWAGPVGAFAPYAR